MCLLLSSRECLHQLTSPALKTFTSWMRVVSRCVASGSSTLTKLLLPWRRWRPSRPLWVCCWGWSQSCSPSSYSGRSMWMGSVDRGGASGFWLHPSLMQDCELPFLHPYHSWLLCCGWVDWCVIHHVDTIMFISCLLYYLCFNFRLVLSIH